MDTKQIKFSAKYVYHPHSWVTTGYSCYNVKRKVTMNVKEESKSGQHCNCALRNAGNAQNELPVHYGRAKARSRKDARYVAPKR